MSQPPQPRVEVVDQKGNALLLRVFTKGQYQPLICRLFLVGQDSNLTTIPFVTQVKRKLQTVEKAFDSLMPLPVKQAVAKGLAVRRQGDFFFVPSDPPQGPSYDMKADVERTWPGDRRVPRTFDPYVLYHYGEATRHRVLDLGFEHLGNFVKGEIVYRANAHHLVRGIVRAPDHEDLYLTDWHTAYRANSGPWGRNGRQAGGD